MASSVCAGLVLSVDDVVGGVADGRCKVLGNATPEAASTVFCASVFIGPLEVIVLGLWEVGHEVRDDPDKPEVQCDSCRIGFLNKDDFKIDFFFEAKMGERRIAALAAFLTSPSFAPHPGQRPPSSGDTRDRRCTRQTWQWLQTHAPDRETG